MAKTIRQYLREKALGISGLIMPGVDPRIRADRLTYVNNIEDITHDRIREYNIWYIGDANELLNFYTRMNNIDYNTDPIYNRNNKSYFWAQSSTENDIKRTHSGQPRVIVDTLNNIIGMPTMRVESPVNAPTVLEKVDEILQTTLKKNRFTFLLKQKARPLTLVEGWGAWKVNFDTAFSDYPIILYYRADAVDFFYRSNQLVGICYRDYYQDAKGNEYILFELRRRDKKDLIIEKELFRVGGGNAGDGEVLIPCKLTDLPQLKDIKPQIKVSNYEGFLGCPNIYFYDSSEDCPGRSIFTGRIDLFDDLDQAYSQSANAVRRSTVVEYFNNLYLERDKQGMPMMPHSFDRKYVQYRGVTTGDGTATNANPVTVTQPNINFAQYSQEETNIMLNILSGLMSPATMGIDIAKKDNAEAQREKEKVTIFTKQGISDEERDTLTVLVTDILAAYQLMHKGEITVHNFSINIKYDQFANASLESTASTVQTMWEGGLVSDEMAVDLLWGDRIDSERRDTELKFLKEQRKAQEARNRAGMGEDEPEPDSDLPEDQGAFGELGKENEYNDVHSKQTPQEQHEIPDLEKLAEETGV